MQRLSWDWTCAEEMREPTASEISHNIDERVIGLHAERNRALLKRRFIDGICFEPLAEEFGLSVRQAKNIVKKYREKVF